MHLAYLVSQLLSLRLLTSLNGLLHLRIEYFQTDKRKKGIAFVLIPPVCCTFFLLIQISTVVFNHLMYDSSFGE